MKARATLTSAPHATQDGSYKARAKVHNTETLISFTSWPGPMEPGETVEVEFVMGGSWKVRA